MVRKIVLLLLILLTVNGFTQHKRKKRKHAKARTALVLPVRSVTSDTTSIDSMITFAKSYLGTPYRRRSAGPSAFDCAGFTQFVFNRFHVKLPRDPANQAAMGNFIERDEIKKGDILFFKGRNAKSKRIGHVALVISADSNCVRMIHAASRGITIDNLDSLFYYRKRYLGARRIITHR